jgi:hypothetical protein
MELILKDKPFIIERAELSASVPDPYWLRKYHPGGDPRLFWSLDVWAEGELGGDVCSPRASIEEMHLPIQRWVDVAGQTIEWLGPYDEKAGVPNGIFYIEQHESIERARLRFTQRDGTAFRFEWEGACDIYWDEEYGRDVPFSMAGWARFIGVTVFGSGADTAESLWGRLAQYLDPRDFVLGELVHSPHRYDSGVKMVHAKFTPSDERTA